MSTGRGLLDAKQIIGGDVVKRRDTHHRVERRLALVFLVVQIGDAVNAELVRHLFLSQPDGAAQFKQSFPETFHSD